MTPDERVEAALRRYRPLDLPASLRSRALARVRRRPAAEWLAAAALVMLCLALRAATSQLDARLVADRGPSAAARELAQIEAVLGRELRLAAERATVHREPVTDLPPEMGDLRGARR